MRSSFAVAALALLPGCLCLDPSAADQARVEALDVWTRLDDACQRRMDDAPGQHTFVTWRNFLYEEFAQSERAYAAAQPHQVRSESDWWVRPEPDWSEALAEGREAAAPFILVLVVERTCGRVETAATLHPWDGWGADGTPPSDALAADVEAFFAAEGLVVPVRALATTREEHYGRSLPPVRRR